MSILNTLRKVFGGEQPHSSSPPAPAARTAPSPTTPRSPRDSVPSPAPPPESPPVPKVTRADLEKAEQEKDVALLAVARDASRWVKGKADLSGLNENWVWNYSRKAAERLAQFAVAENDRETLWKLGELFCEETLKVLQCVRDPGATPVLVALLTHQDFRIRTSAIQAVGEIRAAAAVEPLIAGLAVGSEEDRKRIYEALGKIGDSRAKNALTAAVEHESNAGILQKVLPALCQVAPAEDAFQTLMAQFQQAAEKGESKTDVLADALIKIGDPRSVPALKERLNQGLFSNRVRHKAAKFIYGDERTWLEQLKAARNWTAVRSAIGKDELERMCQLLSSQGDTEALLSWADLEVARNALATIRAPRAVPALLAALGHGEPDVRRAAGEALGEIGDQQAVEPLIKLLRESPCRAAAESLAKLGGPRALQALREVLESNSGVAMIRSAAEGLVRAAPPEEAFQALVKGFQAAQEENLGQLAAVLLKVGRQREEFFQAVMKRFMTAPDGSKVQIRLAVVLAEIGDRRAVPLLEKMRSQGVLGAGRIDELDAFLWGGPEPWAQQQKRGKDYASLAAVFNSEDSSPEFQREARIEAARKVLLEAGEEAVDALVLQFMKGARGEKKLGELLLEIGSPKAIPVLKARLAHSDYSHSFFTDARKLIYGDLKQLIISLLDSSLPKGEQHRQIEALLSEARIGTSHHVPAYCACGYPVRHVYYPDRSSGPIFELVDSRADPDEMYTQIYSCPRCKAWVATLTS
jgi:HEAT repeat protein